MGLRAAAIPARQKVRAFGHLAARAGGCTRARCGDRASPIRERRFRRGAASNRTSAQPATSARAIRVARRAIRTLCAEPVSAHFQSLAGSRVRNSRTRCLRSVLLAEVLSEWPAVPRQRVKWPPPSAARSRAHRNATELVRGEGLRELETR